MDKIVNAQEHRKMHTNLKKVITSDMTADEEQLSSSFATKKGSHNDFWEKMDSICFL